MVMILKIFADYGKKLFSSKSCKIIRMFLFIHVFGLKIPTVINALVTAFKKRE